MQFRFNLEHLLGFSFLLVTFPLLAGPHRILLEQFVTGGIFLSQQISRNSAARWDDNVVGEKEGPGDQKCYINIGFVPSSSWQALDSILAAMAPSWIVQLSKKVLSGKIPPLFPWGQTKWD